MEQLAAVRWTRRDTLLLVTCGLITLLSIILIARYFTAAFPEASIEFRYDRSESRIIAERLLQSQRLSTGGMKHAVLFESDDIARIFLERSLGVERANQVVRDGVRLWYWRHRWFRPLQEEEYTVEVAPTGQIVSMTREIPESRAMATVGEGQARAVAHSFLRRIGVPAAELELVAESERRLPNRLQRIFTWQSRSLKPAGAFYRHTITVDGDAVSSYAQRLRVPDNWLRSYRELRSKNLAAGNVDTIFLAITMIAALAVFIARLRRGDLRVRFLVVVGIITVILVGGVSANSIPSALASYDTTTSYSAFVAQIIIFTALQSIGTAMMLIVICGSGEVLYRERLPQHLAIPSLWNRRALSSKRVFISLVLGYTLVAFFIAYQVGFYIVAARFGAWSPADVPYDDILNTAIPWVAVLFAGFFPAMSEEFLSRAFSIPFFQRVLRSRWAAIILAGFIWGFGHATYPNQPFYIRGVEVGIAGVIIGLLMDRFGLLALLIWHYTVDAVYTSLLLFRSGNAYYIASAGLAAAVFAIPLVISLANLIRNRGFLPDEELTNAALPVAPPPPAEEEVVPVVLPARRPLTRRQLLIALAAVIAAGTLLLLRGSTPQDVIDYRITSRQAKEIAVAHLASLREPLPEMVAAVPVSGFRLWDPDSAREEGGAPNGFDDVAATHMLREGMSTAQLLRVMRDEVHAATWMVRFFTPQTKRELFVEVDPRTSRVIGYHEYAEENAPGPRLTREAALQIARGAFALYGANPNHFEAREALSFQQPNRLDWLFHFQQRQPLAGEAVRRATVRVMGDEVTQFNITVKVPEAVYREARQQTLLSVILVVLRILGFVALLSLIVAGMVLATREGKAMWKRALWITVALAIIPLSGAVAGYEARLFSYSTSVAWDTFRLNLFTDIVRTAGLQMLLIFVAAAGISAAYPQAMALLTREGRARHGRASVAAALGALGVIVAARELVRILARQFPAMREMEEIALLDSLGLPIPSFFETGDALLGAILFSGAAALYARSVSAWPRPRMAAVVTMLIAFCLAIDSDATLRNLPLAILAAAITAVLVWVVARHLLNGYLLAWPLVAFTGSLLQSAAMLAQNARPDLRVHAAVLVALAAAALVWAAYPRSRENSI